MKSRELIKKMVRWNDPAMCDAAELCDPALAGIAGSFDKEGDVLGVGAPELGDEGVIAGADEEEDDVLGVGAPELGDEGVVAGADEEEDDVLGVGAPELGDEGVVAGEEVGVVITDVGVPGVVDEGAAAGLWVVYEVGVASA
jgi:hypothetical protein